MGNALHFSGRKPFLHEASQLMISREYSYLLDQAGCSPANHLPSPFRIYLISEHHCFKDLSLSILRADHRSLMNRAGTRHQDKVLVTAVSSNRMSLTTGIIEENKALLGESQIQFYCYGKRERLRLLSKHIHQPNLISNYYIY